MGKQSLDEEKSEEKRRDEDRKGNGGDEVKKGNRRDMTEKLRNKKNNYEFEKKCLRVLKSLLKKYCKNF